MGNNNEIKVYLTSRKSPTEYATEQEITQYVINESFGDIVETMDSTDYDFGIFTFGEINLVVQNKDGKFNSTDDWRSLFQFSRDLAKIRISLVESDLTRSNQTITASTVTETDLFIGIINEEATVTDAQNETVNFIALSLNSIFRKTKVNANVVSDADTVSAALYNMLNQDSVKSLLTVDSANINPDNDFAIDVGAHFDNTVLKDSLNELLLASNSILYIDSSLNVIVASRDERAALSTLTFYGPYDQYGRGNIQSIQDYNNGNHRMFNSVKINEIEANDSGFVEEFGLRQKEITAEYLTTDATELTIANSLLAEFKEPRDEMQISLNAEDIKSSQLLQKVSINYPLRLSIEDGDFLPIFGQAIYGDSETPYPKVHGGFSIHPNQVFKIIEKRINLQSMIGVLKLRQTNTGYSA
ncbi:MAG: hypothetical protein KC483_10000 [Nitrosarchaeum sp.]|nr:hypothetical protein [Nitrosarchaeum sp.]